MSAKSELNVVMGCMTFGDEGKGQVRVSKLEDIQAILDVFKKHGHKEIDTARVYGGGSSEEVLGKLQVEKQGLLIETKLYPTVAMNMPGMDAISHSAEDVRKHLEESLKALQVDCLEMFYLHGPDRTTPYEVTMKAVNDLYKEGKFKRFGISNYYSWEVAEIVTLCRANGWIQPTAYQGIYNAIHRAAEPELFPCLRKYGISFYEFNPLGGGFFTGRYKDMNSSVEAGARFDANTKQGSQYRQRYWNEQYFKALEVVDKAAAESGLTMAEIALRWVSHHSVMKRDHGDSVIIGASSVKHLEENLRDLEKGPLPEQVVKAVDEAWDVVKGSVVKYWH